MIRWICEDGIGKRGHIVSDDDFLEQADQDQRDPAVEIVPVEIMLRLQLRQHVALALDGARDQLREEAAVHREEQKIPGWRRGAPVDVNGVADALERMKRETQRQNDAPTWLVETNAQDAERVNDGDGKKQQIFVIGEHAERDGDADNHPEAALALNFRRPDHCPDKIVPAGRGSHERRVGHAPDRIEQVRRNEEHHHPLPDIRQQVVDDDRHREKDNVLEGVEKH